MGLNSDAVQTAMTDHLKNLGLFTRVNEHEPKNAPGNGLVVAAWLDDVSPVALASGLAITSARVAYSVRMYKSMLAEPQDGIDRDLLRAFDTVMAEYTGHFTLGGLVGEVDLLGSYGNPLAGKPGYLEQDGKLYRVMVITVPLILYDVWTQVA